MLPDFIIIGGMKCGTTSLYHYLTQHPEVEMSRLKETDFFIETKNYGRGLDWYRSLFSREDLLHGEASPNYTKAHAFHGVPEKMYNLIPGVKLIYLVRDPVQRIISHHTHNYAAGRPYGIDKLYHHYLMCSRYYWQLTRYLEFFSEEQILVISTENLLNKRKQTLHKIYTFLQVGDFYSETFNERFGTSKSLRRRGRLSSWLLGKPYLRTLKKMVPEGVLEPLKNILQPPVNRKLKLGDEIIRQFREDLREDVELLREYTGEPFEQWDL